MSLQPVVSNNKDLGFSRYHSNLKLDYSSGVSSFTVYSISQFAVNQVLLIGEWGNEGTEIVLTHAATSPSGETVTLASPLAKSHTKDTPVSIIPFDQIEFHHSLTLTGSKSLLGTSPYTIDPEQDEMTYEDATNTSGYYFTRYKNSITGNYSDYSDGIPYLGLPNNTVGYAIDTAMNELNQPFTERLTFPMLIGFAKQMLRLVRGKLRAWSKYQEYDYNFGTVSQGVRRFALPTTLYDQNSNRSILTLRVGSGIPLSPIDREEYVRRTEDTAYTEVATEAAIADVALVLDDTSNLDDSGVVYAYKAGTKYTIEYTANNRSTNTLTVAADQITVILPVDTPIWQGVEESEPTVFNVSDGYLYLWPMVDATLEGRDIIGDFYTDIEDINSQMDVILGTKYDMLIPYLKYKIRAIVDNNGREDLNDPSYSEFRELLQDARVNDAGAEVDAFSPRRRAHSRMRDNDLRRADVDTP
jgi:hypothetical protein